MLINGEFCIKCAKDIFKHYPNLKNKINYRKKHVKAPDIPEYLKNVYEVINKSGVNIDEICRSVKATPKDIISKLTILEMQGFIVQYPGKIFAIL